MPDNPGPGTNRVEDPVFARSFSMLDPRWCKAPLGVAGGHTIGTAGCLVSASAGMLCDSFNFDTDPGRLNRWLCRAGGYVQGNLLKFSILNDLAALSGQVIDCYNVPAPMAEVKKVINAGGGAVGLVDFYPGGTIQQHWIRILRVTERDCLVHDPWLPPGFTQYWLLPAYAHWTWDNAARAIFRLALWWREDKPVEVVLKDERLKSVRAAAYVQPAVFIHS